MSIIDHQRLENEPWTVYPSRPDQVDQSTDDSLPAINRLVPKVALGNQKVERR